MTKREAMRKAHWHVAELIRTVVPGDLWDHDEWDGLSEADQGRCQDALELIADRHAAAAEAPS